MKRSRRRRRFTRLPEPEVMAEINITPLTDVLLVLVIIFLITASGSIFGFNFHLPEGTPKKFIAHKFKGITVTIPAWSSEKHAVFVEGHLVNLDILPNVLAQEYARKQTGELVMRIDNRVPYGIVIQVMDAAKTIGINNISLAAPVVVAPQP